MPYFAYIIQSDMDGSFYIGSCQDVDKRLIKHNFGYSRYTAKKRPWKIVYTEQFETKRDALLRERFLKKQRNREFYFRLIDSKR